MEILDVGCGTWSCLVAKTRIPQREEDVCVFQNDLSRE